MKKNISVILKQDMHNLGKAGHLITVKRGYAFNYLIPNNIVQTTSKGLIKHYTMLNNLALKRRAAITINSEELSKKIEQISKITIRKKIGKDQLIFGSINDKEILSIIEQRSSIKLEKQQIKIPIIKRIGLYSLEIQILNTVKTELKLQVIPEDI